MIARVLSFHDVPGWEAAQMDGTLGAFLCPSDEAALTAAKEGQRHFAANAPDLPALVAELRLGARTLLETSNQPGADPHCARDFFQTNFVPLCLEGCDREHASANPRPGLVTGYFEAHAKAARERSDNFTVPLLRRPADLVSMGSEADRAKPVRGFSHMRQTASGLEPYATRREIETAGPDNPSDVIAYLADPVEAFILHVQGSGQLLFPDGSQVRVTYDGKNGHPYTSVGKEMIREGHIRADDMSLDTMTAWLRANPGRAQDLLWRNASYVFFRELEKGTCSPLGVMNSQLIPFRSLAVDTSCHVLGLPVFVDALDLDAGISGKRGFRELMMAHDVGSAIVGAHRGDIFYGSGPEAGERAGATKHAAALFALIPRELAGYFSPASLSDRRDP